MEAAEAARAVAAHFAAMDSFARAARPGVADEKAVRLRANALAAGRMFSTTLQNHRRQQRQLSGANQPHQPGRHAPMPAPASAGASSRRTPGSDPRPLRPRDPGIAAGGMAQHHGTCARAANRPRALTAYRPCVWRKGVLLAPYHNVAYYQGLSERTDPAVHNFQRDLMFLLHDVARLHACRRRQAGPRPRHDPGAMGHPDLAGAPAGPVAEGTGGNPGSRADHRRPTDRPAGSPRHGGAAA